jgi:hypothetical protein
MGRIAGQLVMEHPSVADPAGLFELRKVIENLRPSHLEG